MRQNEYLWSKGLICGKDHGTLTPPGLKYWKLRAICTPEILLNLPYNKILDLPNLKASAEEETECVLIIEICCRKDKKVVERRKL